MRLRYRPSTNHGVPIRQRLRIVGESDVFWKWRCEAGFPFHFYQSIADALVTGLATDELYCLHLTGAGETWPRAAYALSGVDDVAGTDATFSVMVRTDRLRVAAGGEVIVAMGVYQRRPGRSNGDVFDPPDAIHRLRVPPGTRAWTRLSMRVRIPRTAAYVLVRIAGRQFSGELWVGSPRLYTRDGDTVLPPLAPDNRHWPRMNWLGENLSRAEWPEFEVALDGRSVWSGPVFSPVVRAPDFEVALPAVTQPTRIDVTLIKGFPRALPFVVRHAEVLEDSARAIEIIAFPEYVAEGRPFPVLFERCGKAGVELDVAMVRAGKAGGRSRFAVELDGQAVVIEPRRIVRREDDGITLSTGDAVYVPQTPEAFTRFIGWYTMQRLGNAICFRPVYRWCGSRTMRPDAWQAAVRLLQKLGLRYHLMVDGRELPGMHANPPDRLLRSPLYMGRQAHEQDGAFCYWGGRRSRETLFMDLLARGKDNGGIFPAVHPPPREGDEGVSYFDRERVRDMREGEAYFVENLRRGKGASTRHTGPSTLFRYFFKAGYDWVGAEQMYSAEEVVLAAARGATAAYRRQEFGAHLAMQWSSCPHDSPAHAARYFLALATCYMQGVGNINTEEGLYRMESEYAEHDRFSDACQRHRSAHTVLRRFMETHTRRGRLRVPVAVLQGRHCAWRCFGRGPAWNSARPEFAFGPPEASFDLLKVFYPRSVLDAIYKNPCSDDRPFGWYTGTPYGPVDLLPIEAPVDVLRRYSAAAFLGWNTFKEPDFRRLLEFVEAGGVLLLARPHVSREVRRLRPAWLPDSKTLDSLLGRGWQHATGRCERSVGRGRAIYYADDLYPAAAGLRRAYEVDLRRLGEQAALCERPRGWLAANADVSFTAYDWPDGRTRTLYVLNTDWWSGRTMHAATLLLGRRAFKIPVRLGTIEVLTIRDGVAVMPESADADVLEIDMVDGGGRVRVQSDRGTSLRIYRETAARPVRLAVSRGGVEDARFAPL